MIAPHIHTYCPHCGRTWTAEEIIEQSCTDCPYPMREADAFVAGARPSVSGEELIAMMLIEGRYAFDRPQVDRGVARPDVGQGEAA